MMMVAAFFLMMVVALFLLVVVALTLLVVVVALTLLVVVALLLMMMVAAFFLMMVVALALLVVVALLLMMMFFQYLLHQLRSQISIAFKGVQDILSIQLLQRRRNHGRLFIVFSHQIDRFLHRLLIGSVRSC